MITIHRHYDLLDHASKQYLRGHKSLLLFSFRLNVGHHKGLSCKNAHLFPLELLVATLLLDRVIFVADELCHPSERWGQKVARHAASWFPSC